MIKHIKYMLKQLDLNLILATIHTEELYTHWTYTHGNFTLRASHTQQLHSLRDSNDEAQKQARNNESSFFIYQTEGSEANRSNSKLIDSILF